MTSHNITWHPIVRLKADPVLPTNPVRRVLFDLVVAQHFETIIMLHILLNAGLMTQVR